MPDGDTDAVKSASRSIVILLPALLVGATACGSGRSLDSSELGRCPDLGGGFISGHRAGSDEQLVPIAATSLRICRYDETTDKVVATSRGVEQAEVKRMEIATNLLPLQVLSYSCDRFVNIPRYALTFADRTRRVNVVDDSCGVVTNDVNGTMSHGATATWLRDVQVLIPKPAG